MSEQDQPLYQIVWQRFLKRCGDVPPLAPHEHEFMKTIQLKRNRLAMLQALLLTSAIVVLVKADIPTVDQIWQSTGAKFPGMGTHSRWYLAALLIFGALIAPWLSTLGLRTWRYCVRSNFLPVVAACGLFLVFYNAGIPCLSFFLRVLGGLLFFVASSSLLWTPRERVSAFKDRLQRNYFADRILEHFQNADTLLRRIAILGGWGTGKTVVLQLLRERLLQSASPRFGVAMINPWVAQSSEEIHAMIAQAFDEALGFGTACHGSLRARLGWLSWLTGIKTGSGATLTFDLKQLFHGGSSEQEERLIERINHTLSAVKRVCVILVDDMERAEPEIIRKVFPVIDTLRRIKPCFFVFGIDPARIAKAFGETTRSDDQTKGFIDKVFDLQIELPQARSKDVALLCNDLLSEHETPKLKSAWSLLAPHISENPREAKHFLNDAVTKEVLFLSRYGADEHDYTGFFKLRMLELELPGISQKITEDIVKKYREEIYLARRDSSAEKVEEALGTAWTVAKPHNSSLPPNKEDRLKRLFSEVLDSDVDLAWACHHHMRLLTLNATERELLHKVWQTSAGKTSIFKMVETAVPDKEFGDMDRIGASLIGMEVASYEKTRGSLIGSRTSPQAVARLKEAKLILSRLTEHLCFSLSLESLFDRNCYPSDYFIHWLESLFQGGALPDTLTETRSLREMETRHSIQVSNLLSLGEAFHFVRWPTNNVIQQYSISNSRTDLSDDIDRLREHIQHRVSRELVDYIRKGDLDRHSFLGLFRTHSLAEVFGEFEAWKPQRDNCEVLRNLESEIDTNENAAKSMAEIAKSLLHVVSYVTRNGDLGRFAPAFQEINKAPPVCVAMIWQMALRSTEHVDDLQSYRNYVRASLHANSQITVDQFDSAFA